MSVPATNRAPLLALVPASDRKLVEARLRLWDRLPDTAPITLAGGTLNFIASPTGTTTEVIGDVTLAANTNSTISSNSNGGTAISEATSWASRSRA